MKISVVCMSMFILVLLAPGCEKVTTRATIQVTPESAIAENRGGVTLTASIPENERETRQLYYPLVWRVSNQTVGTVQQTAGNTAVYMASTTKGVNTLTVKDQSGAEGIATITHQ